MSEEPPLLKDLLSLLYLFLGIFELESVQYPWSNTKIQFV